MSRRYYPPTEGDIPMHGWRPYSEMHRERIRAHAKHDGNGGSMERKAFDDPAWLPVLTEEVGEVARALCDFRHLTSDRDKLAAQLREELIQVGAMAAAWLDAIENDQGEQPRQGIVRLEGCPHLVCSCVLGAQPICNRPAVHDPADPLCTEHECMRGDYGHCDTCAALDGEQS